MKKLILVLAIAGVVGLTSCEKCHSCTGANINELNHDYCTEVYRTSKSMDDAKDMCEVRGGTWTEDEK